MAKFEYVEDDDEFVFEKGYESVSSDLSITADDIDVTINDRNSEGEPTGVSWDAFVGDVPYFANSAIIKAGPNCSDPIEFSTTTPNETRTEPVASSGELNLTDTDLGVETPAISNIVFCKDLFWEADFANTDKVFEEEPNFGTKGKLDSLYEFATGSLSEVYRYSHVTQQNGEFPCLDEDLDGDGNDDGKTSIDVDPNGGTTSITFNILCDDTFDVQLANYEAPGPTRFVKLALEDKFDLDNASSTVGQKLVDTDVRAVPRGETTLEADLPRLP